MKIISMQRKHEIMRNRYLAGPIFAEEVTDNAFAGLDDGEEVFLGRNLGIFAMSEGDPTATLLRHFLHLLQPAFPKGFEIVIVEAFEGGDLFVDLVLDGLRNRQYLFLDHLFDLSSVHLLLSDLSLSPSLALHFNFKLRLIRRRLV